MMSYSLTFNDNVHGSHLKVHLLKYPSFYALGQLATDVRTRLSVHIVVRYCPSVPSESSVNHT